MFNDIEWTHYRKFEKDNKRFKDIISYEGGRKQ